MTFPLIMNIINIYITKFTINTMDGFKRRKEQKKESIRQAALELFKHHGISRTTLKDVAAKASVSPVSIYNHFGSKQGLVRDVIKWHINDVVARYKGILNGDLSFMEKMETIIFDKKRMMRNYSAEFIQTVISQDPEIKRFFEEVSADMVRNMAGFLEQGRREGCIDPSISQEALMLYFEVLRKGIADHGHIFNSPERNEELLKQFSHIYLYGLVGKAVGGNERSEICRE